MSSFDFLTFLSEEMTRVRLKSQRDTVFPGKTCATKRNIYIYICLLSCLFVVFNLSVPEYILTF